MRHEFRSFAVLTAALLLSVALGCGGTNYACGDGAVGQSAVGVTIYDARTGQPAATGATATLSDGSLTETLTTPIYDYSTASQPGALLGYSGGHGAGTFTITVQKAGYTTWQRTNVRVTQGPCMLNGVSVRADLQPTQ
jgi:hypothetical protein